MRNRRTCTAAWWMLSLLLSLALSTGCQQKAPPAKPAIKKPPGKAAARATSPKQPSATKRKTGPAEPSDASPQDEPTAGKATAENQPPEQPPFDAPRATERLLVFTPEGPLIVDLVLSIDGRPYRDAREKLIEQMIASADSDGDEQLRWTEALDSPWFAFEQAAQPAQMDARQRRQQIMQFDLNRDGLVQPDEARRFVGRSGNAGRGFSLDASSRRSNGPSAAWRLLDGDANGVLTSGEIDAAGLALASRDADENELLRPGEIDGRTAEPSARERAFARAEPSVVRLDAGANWGSLYYRIEDAYLHDGRLVAESFPLDPQLVDRLDRNGDGEFDSAEAPELAKVPPHVLLEIKFGESEARPRGMHLRRLAGATGVAAKTPAGEEANLEPGQRATAAASENNEAVASASVKKLKDGLLLSLAGVRLRLQFQDVPQGQLEELVQAQMQALDKDKNGYLEKDELSEGQQALASQFAAFDVDGDAKLFPKELLAALLWRRAPQLTRIQATAFGRGHALFPALDANNDRQLSAREMQEAPTRLRELDANRDGTLTHEEVPAMISLVLRRGEAASATMGEPATPGAGDETDDAPAWFAAMEANGDGDLSRREFLGAPAQFDRLDKNHDGFIDVGEARAVEENTAPEESPQTGNPPAARTEVK